MKELYSGKLGRQIFRRCDRLPSDRWLPWIRQTPPVDERRHRGIGCCWSWNFDVFATTLALLSQAIRFGIANAAAGVQAFRNVDAIHDQARRDDRPLAPETSLIYEALVTRV